MKSKRLTKKIAEQFLAGEIDDILDFDPIDPAAALLLAKYEGALCLGITELSDTAAEALAHHDGGGLTLERLRVLTEGAAKALAFHKGSQYKEDWGGDQGELNIGYIDTSDWDGASEELSNYRAANCKLNLAEGAARALAQGRTAFLTLQLDYLSHEDAEALAQSENYLSLPRLKALTNSNLARKLVFTREGEPDEVSLESCREPLSAEVALALASYPGVLQLSSLESISDEVAEIFANALVTGALRGLSLNTEATCSPHARRTLMVAGGLGTDELTDLDVDFAGALATRRGGLCLDGLTELSVEVAVKLGNHAEMLWLNGLSELSEKASSALGNHRGGLGLNGLSTLPDRIAEKLANSKGGLVLNGLAELSSKGAKALAEHEGDLTLEGLASLTANAASALASHNGRLFINVAELSDDAAKELCNPKGEVFGTICGQDAEEFLKQFKS